MARNREFVNESESDSGGVDGSSDEEYDSEPEPTQTRTLIAAKPQQQLRSSSEEEDSGSESDSDGPDSNVKPLAYKFSVPVAVTPAKSTAPKRPAEETDESKEPKKPRTAEAETSEKKSNPFERLWSEDDEIVVLKGMMDYSSEKNSDPMSDLNAFHEFIKKNLHADFSRAQLQDKIRRLKKKFVNNKAKVREGKEMTTFKPHEQNVYDLSKLIWGNETANGSTVVRKTASKKANAPVSEEVKEVKSAMGPMKLNSSMEERMLLAGRDLEGEDEWEELKVEELELYLKQLELRVMQTRLILDTMKAKKENR